jgi:hypothetical protein
MSRLKAIDERQHILRNVSIHVVYYYSDPEAMLGRIIHRRHLRKLRLAFGGRSLRR